MGDTIITEESFFDLKNLNNKNLIKSAKPQRARKTVMILKIMYSIKTPQYIISAKGQFVP